MAEADSIKDAAEDILGQPQYRVPEPGVLERVGGWLGDQLQPVGDAIGRFLAWLATRLGVPAGGIGAGGGSGGFVLGWVFLAVAAAAVIWFLVRVMPRRRLRSKHDDTPTIEQRSRHRTTRREWLERAAAAEAAGDFTGAVRARYRALVAGLADRNELDGDEAVTSGEHLRAFTAESDRREGFTRATTTYEQAWYGEYPVGPEESGDLEGIDEALVEGSRR